jgi:HSP20 family molecular chaperone IbpA
VACPRGEGRLPGQMRGHAKEVGDDDTAGYPWQPARRAVGPFVEFEDLYDRMGRLTGSVAGGPAGQLAALAWSPLADVSETDNAYLIEADLPG